MKLFIVLALTIAAISAQHIPILSQSQENNPDGSYKYAFETANGINTQETGVGGQYAQGGYQYISPDGTPVYLSYYSDATGFHPEGSHIPTPPPVPTHILRALEWIKAHPSKESQGF